MKDLKFLYIPLFVLLAWLGWRWMDPLSAVQADKPSVAIAKGDAPTKIENDPVKIFQRAFWTSPTSEDTILHAERREWSGADGLEKWEWFLVVKPSPSLLKHLRDDNAFGLVPTSAAPVVSEAPAWFRFKPDDFAVLQASHAGMRLMFSKSDNTLYATDSGRGFTKGAPEPPPATQGAQTPGRIPSSPPPRPKPGLLKHAIFSLSACSPSPRRWESWSPVPQCLSCSIIRDASPWRG